MDIDETDNMPDQLIGIICILMHFLYWKLDIIMHVALWLCLESLPVIASMEKLFEWVDGRIWNLSSVFGVPASSASSASTSTPTAKLGTNLKH